MLAIFLKQYFYTDTLNPLLPLSWLYWWMWMYKPMVSIFIVLEDMSFICSALPVVVVDPGEHWVTNSALPLSCCFLHFSCADWRSKFLSANGLKNVYFQPEMYVCNFLSHFSSRESSGGESTQFSQVIVQAHAKQIHS